MTVRSTLITQDYRVIILDLGDKDIKLPAEGFDNWLYENHPDVFTKYVPEGKNTSFFDIIFFNQSANAKRYYLQYLNQLITKEIDLWDKVNG